MDALKIANLMGEAADKKSKKQSDKKPKEEKPKGKKC